MRITLSRTARQVDRDSAYKYVHEAVIRLWKDSVKAFINECSQHIHIDTGMSMASLQPLAANVRLSSFLQASLAGKGFVRGVYSETGKYDPNGFRSKAEGRRRGERAYTLSFGTPMAMDLKFTFKILVYQWKLHELGVRGKPQWEALKKGREAFLLYFNSNFTREVKAGVFLRVLGGLRK